MKNKTMLGIILVPAFVLLVPLVAMQFTAEVNWTLADFTVAWILMAGVGFAYKLVTRKTEHIAYRAAAGLAVATAFILVWLNLAVGLIGSEHNPANLMYGGVLAIGLIGAAVARFRSRGMARTLFAVTLAQLLVPLIAVMIWKPDFTPGVAKVLGLNTVFVVLFAGSSWLFRYAAAHPDASDVRMPG